MALSLNITGLEEFEKKLLAIGQEMAAKNLVASVNSAAKVVEDEAKANLLVDGSIDTGLLFRSIRRKKILYNSGTIVVVVGPSKGVSGFDKQGNRRVPYKYAHLVEKHTQFMSRASTVTREAVIKKIAESLRRKLKRHTT